MIYIFFGPLHLCKMELEKNQCEYCKNKGLIYAVAQIGLYRSIKNKKSIYKRGIDFICEAYEQQYHEGLSKTEVRRLLRPNCKRKHCLKIPKKTIKILECISQYIDNPADGTPHNNCAEMKCVFSKKIQQESLHCYYYLVYDLVKQFRAVEGRIDKNSLIYDIFKQIENHPKTCHK